MAELTKDAAGNTAFDLKRQGVDAQAERDRKQRLSAVNRQLSSQGITDSGITTAQNRLTNADVSQQAAASRGGINIAELESRGKIDEAQKARDFQASEAALSRSLTGDLTREGFGVQTRAQDIGKELGLGEQKIATRGQDINRDLTTRGQDIDQGIASRGLDITEAGQQAQTELGFAELQQNAEIAKQKLGLEGIQITNQNQQFYSSLKQAMDIAQQGFSLEQSAQVLTEKGIDNTLAFNMASLAQAKELANQGFDLQVVAQELQAKGLDLQNAQYYAGLTQDAALMQQELDNQINKLFIGEAVAALEPGGAQYQEVLKEMAESFDVALPELSPETIDKNKITGGPSLGQAFGKGREIANGGG